MGYWTHHTVEKGEDGQPKDDFLGILVNEPDKQVDYMAVVLFVFRLLDTGMPVSQLSDVLDLVGEHIPDDDLKIATTSLGRARLASGLVDAFLLKDSFERAKKEDD